MDPSTEQLVRDYLNRVAVAARGRLDSDGRRRLLARIRESIEHGSRGSADPAATRRLLSGLGEPETLVEQERAQIAAAGAEPGGPTGLWSGRRKGRSADWLRRHAARRGRPVYQPPEPGPAPEPDPDPASAVPFIGEIKIQARPISARRRPGAPLQPRSHRPRRPPWTGAAGRAQSGSAAATGAPGTQPAEAEVPESAVPGPALAGPGPASSRPGPAPAAPARPSRPGWPHRAPGRSSQPDQPSQPGQSGLPGQADQPSLPGQPDQPSRSRQPGWPRRPARPGQGGPGGWVTAADVGAGGRPDGGTFLAAVAARAASVAGAVALFVRQRPLETAAITLLGLGGLIFPPVWLVGVPVALLSTKWDFRDKWAGLAGPPLLLLFGTGAVVVLGGKHASIGGYAHEAWVFADYLSRAVAVAGAVFLTWRVKRGPRDPVRPPWNRPHRI